MVTGVASFVSQKLSKVRGHLYLKIREYTNKTIQLVMFYSVL